MDFLIFKTFIHLLSNLFATIIYIQNHTLLKFHLASWDLTFLIRNWIWDLAIFKYLLLETELQAFVNHLGKHQSLSGFLSPHNIPGPTSFYQQLIYVQTVAINVNIGSRKTITKWIIQFRLSWQWAICNIFIVCMISVITLLH